MKTRLQIREQRKKYRLIIEYKYKNWKWGKTQFGSNYNLKNCNTIIKDRCNGDIYGQTSGWRLDWRLGDYTGPKTRAMTDFGKRGFWSNYKPK